MNFSDTGVNMTEFSETDESPSKDKPVEHRVKEVTYLVCFNPVLEMELKNLVLWYFGILVF